MHNHLLKICGGLAAAALSVAPCTYATAASENNVSNEAIAALEACERYVAEHSYTTKTYGTIKARVFGVPYKVTTVGSRNVNGKNFHTVDESKSAFINVAFTRSSDGKNFYVTTADYKGGAFVYGTPKQFTFDEYVSHCGQPPVTLTKFDWQNNVLSAAKSDDGEYTYELSVDAATTPARQMTAIMGGKECKYKSVRVTLVTDGKKPVRVTSAEQFTVDKFGGTNCNAEFIEDFYY